MNTAPNLSRKWAARILPGLFVVIPLVFGGLPVIFDVDLYRFALLPKMAVMQIGLVLLAYTYAADSSSGRAVWRSSPVFLPAFLFLLFCALSVSEATNPFAATAFLQYQVALLLAMFLAAQTIDLRILQRISEWACGAAVIFSSIGILEFWGFDVGIPSNGRPSATFGYRNFAATYLIATLPLSAAVTLRATSKSRLLLGVISGLMMSVFLVYTRSRGAWLGAALGAVVLLAIYLRSFRDTLPKGSPLRERSGGLAVAAVAVLFIALAPLSPSIEATHSRDIDTAKTELLDAMSSVTVSGSGRGRWTLWSGSVEMIRAHPVLGVGLDNWKVIYPAHDDGTMIRVGSAPERPHNDFLWIASESGVVSLIVYLWLLLTVLLVAWRIVRARDDRQILVTALLAGIVAVTVHSLFSFPRERVESSFFLWSAMGIIAGLGSSKSIRPDRRATMLSPVLIAACLAITVISMRFDRALLGGLQSLAIGDYVSLSRHASEGIQAGPFDTRIHLLQNKVMQSQRNFAAARQACLDGLSHHPNSPELHGDLGMVYAQSGDPDRAEQSLLRALELSPAQYQTLNNLGGVYQQKGAFAEARKAYEKALRYHPDYPDALSNLGLVLTIEGDYDGAVRAFERAIALAGSTAGLMHNLADALYLRNEEGDRVRAARLYQAFLRGWRGAPEETQIARSRIREISGQ